MPPTDSEVARDRRADVVRPFNIQAADRRAQYLEDCAIYERNFHDDLAGIEQAKREALVAEGLNSNGSDPRGRPQG